MAMASLGPREALEPPAAPWYERALLLAGIGVLMAGLGALVLGLVRAVPAPPPEPTA